MMPVANIPLPDSCSTFSSSCCLPYYKWSMFRWQMMMILMMMASTRLSFQHFPLINMAIFMIINYKVFTANFADSLLRCKLFPSSHQRNYSETGRKTERQIDRLTERQPDRQLNRPTIENRLRTVNICSISMSVYTGDSLDLIKPSLEIPSAEKHLKLLRPLCKLLKCRTSFTLFTSIASLHTYASTHSQTFTFTFTLAFTWPSFHLWFMRPTTN